MDHLLHPARKDKKRDESNDRDSRKEKRGSLGIHTTTKSKDRTSKKDSAKASPGLKSVVPGKFEMIMESPPAILYGSTTYSSGSLLSGRLKFDVVDPSGEVTLTNFNMRLQATTTTKKPISKECADCANKHETLKEWKFLSEPKSFLKMRDNQFPWSYLLEGRFPATTHSALGSITYAFLVNATTSMGETITFTHPLLVHRAIPPGPDKASIRIFPPTNLTGRATMPQIVHPIGKFPVSLTLSGIVEKKSESQTRWRLKKMMWRIEENSKVKSLPCEKHKHKVSEGKAIQHTDTKQLGSDEMKTGWKTDFDTIGGEIMLEFEAQLSTKPTHKASCDVDSASGLEVKHNLVIELIVAEEFVPNRNTNLITPTGAARVLRMQFALTVTERAGMGISWDDEMPPMYEDVPPSPPGYGNADKNDGAFGGAIIEEYNGPDLEYHDLEQLPTNDPNEPPRYRERDPADINAGLPMRHRPLTNDPDESGPSQIRQRLGGFRLDELEAEPALRRQRENSGDSNTEAVVDYAEGTAN
ncbi:Endocytosis regulator [Neophaeococcomyces mojaviensis]|uniref:Endocytosis regulator n=1 Tax=Neophaeococcomyces mojaviensis TaxID=3383035 RepID=A0ACC3AJ69_9EURO|nr:Endocytosis regulator [Knufia sp. JES_112]